MRDASSDGRRDILQMEAEIPPPTLAHDTDRRFEGMPFDLTDLFGKNV